VELLAHWQREEGGEDDRILKNCFVSIILELVLAGAMHYHFNLELLLSEVDMKRFISILPVFLLICIAVAGFAQETQLTQKAADNASLPNGFYLILEEQADTSAFQKPADDEAIVTYTLEHLGVHDQPARHFRVKVVPDVHFSSDAKTELGDKAEGKTTLNVVLGEGNAGEFQKFTAANIDRSVAIIIGGKVVTAHKIRAEIIGGKIQITRCGDDACEALNLWLKDSVAR